MALHESSSFDLLFEAPSLQAPWRQDDWSGISNPVARRKIQNRLNQRASRQRRNKAASSQSPCERDAQLVVSTSANHDNLAKAERAPAPIVSPLRSVFSIEFPQIAESAASCGIDTLALATSSRPSAECIPRLERKSMSSAKDFSSWILSKRLKHGDHAIYPISADHLLTLIHFNVVRAAIFNVITIGVDPDLMSLDIPSPFFSSTVEVLEPKISPQLPWTLQPTSLQRHIPHHPIIDVFPSSCVRDNLLRAGDRYDEDELCHDVLGIVTKPSCGVGSGVEARQGPTGFLVWGEPWNPTSWEVSEEFARKWRWIFVGCEELLESTNHWRGLRGERPLVWELE